MNNSQSPKSQAFRPGLNDGSASPVRHKKAHGESYGAAKNFDSRDHKSHAQPAERKVFRSGASSAISTEKVASATDNSDRRSRPTNHSEHTFFRKDSNGRIQDEQHRSSRRHDHHGKSFTRFEKSERGETSERAPRTFGPKAHDKSSSDFRSERPRFHDEHRHAHSSQHKSAIGAASRAAAAQIVNAVSQGISLTEAFPMFCNDLDSRDNAFVKEIVYGTLRNRRLLMANLNPLFNYKITERHRIVQALLLTAMYQIVYMRSPVHAVVASTVSACGECGRKAFTSLVNAILRRFIREGAQLKNEESAAVNCSFPDWLFEKLQKDYGETALHVMEQSNEKAPLFLRVENSKISTSDYLELLHKDGIEASIVDASFSPCAIRLEHPLNVDDIPGFYQGLCSVQDFSAQMAAPLLQLNQDNLRVLDCCCAPGGKTAHILDLNKTANVTALDVDANRLEQTRATLSRLQRDNVQLQVLDAQNLNQLDGEFDRILLDAPCSGTGVIRRHPDIKWLRREKDIASLCSLQSNILDAAFAKLKVGGILVYTTCSILHDENDIQIKHFLERHKDAELTSFTLGGVTHSTWQRLPGEQQGDGFFYACLVKLPSY